MKALSKKDILNKINSTNTPEVKKALELKLKQLENNETILK